MLSLMYMLICHVGYNGTDHGTDFIQVNPRVLPKQLEQK